MSKAKGYEELLKALGEEFAVRFSRAELCVKKQGIIVVCASCERPMRDAERHIRAIVQGSGSARDLCGDREACRARVAKAERDAKAREKARRSAVVEAVNL